MSLHKLPLHRMLRRTMKAKFPPAVMNVEGITMRGHATDISSEKTTLGGSVHYSSPFQEIFDTIQEGKTFMGTSQFTPPPIKYLKCGIPEHVLRYKTTTYGRLLEAPFVKPNEHKVTLQVDTQHIPLTDIERLVMKEIVGNRWNDDTGLLQLSSSQFGSRIENKRHAVSMLERIVESAKTLASRVEAESSTTEGSA